MNKKEKAFINLVWEHYTLQGRSNLPWRKTKDPYRILVSEVMLQQTQVDRVIPKYKAFLKKFPTAQALADASLSEVLIAWQGLGYNRRAKMLHACVKETQGTCISTCLCTCQQLQKLPGIGPYTAGAILVFACNKPEILIETNIRTAYLHHFFPKDTDVTDDEILLLVKKTMDKDNPRQWYWALMDYGSFIKKTYGNQNTRSKHYIKQSVFKGSNRHIRGAIVRELAESGSIHTRTLHTRLQQFEKARVTQHLNRLCDEGLIAKKGASYFLVS